MALTNYHKPQLLTVTDKKTHCKSTLQAKHNVFFILDFHNLIFLLINVFAFPNIAFWFKAVRMFIRISHAVQHIMSWFMMLLSAFGLTKIFWSSFKKASYCRVFYCQTVFNFNDFVIGLFVFQSKCKLKPRISCLSYRVDDRMSKFQ